MYFYPTWSTCDVLPVIFRTPAFHEAHSYGTHFSEFINGFETVIDALTKKSSKFLIIEDLEATSGWNLAHCCRVEAMVIVTISTLNKYRAVAQALGEHFTTNII